jgi:L-fuculose-phosphate aldolase
MSSTNYWKLLDNDVKVDQTDYKMYYKNSDTINLIIDTCGRLYNKGFVTATDGNVSVRLEGNTFLATRTGINKGSVSENDLIEVDINGTVVSGDHKPSTELAMHLYIYSKRLDINSIVHAHPPYATGFATARQPLTGCVLPEVIVGLGAIPLAEYATPSTGEVIKSIESFVEHTDAIMLSNHGVVTYGKDLLEAFFKMEKVEHAAHITFVARMLGGEKFLSCQDIQKLKTISQEIYGKGFTEKLACEPSDEQIIPKGSGNDIKEFIKDILNK